MKINTTYLNPKTLDDFLFSNFNNKALLSDILDETIPFPAMGTTGLCLHGTYGTGKTTLAKLLPDLIDQSRTTASDERVHCLHRDPIYELTLCKGGNDSLPQVNDISERVNSRMSFSQSGWHFEILDEIDLLTDKAQDILKSLMTANKDTIFIATTNHPTRLNAGLVDRFHMIEMSAATTEDMAIFGKELLKRINLDEDFILEEDLLNYAKRSRGSLRDFGAAILVSASRKLKSIAKTD